MQGIEAEAQKALSKTELKKVAFYSPDQLTAYIQSAVKPKKSENVVKGYRVKVGIEPSASAVGEVHKKVAKTILENIKQK